MTKNKICLFCEQPLAGVRAKEHALPRWLQEHLGIADTQVSPTHFSAATGRAVATREHVLSALVEGHVCEACNGGWMNDLEGAVSPILKPLMSGELGPADIAADDRLILARWAAKTVFMINSSSNLPQKVPRGHLVALRAGAELPKQVIAVAQLHHNDEPFYWLQGATWIARLAATSADAFEALQGDSYKITLQLGKLLLCVAYWPAEQFRYVINAGVHVPVWPLKQPIGWYEADFPWSDSKRAVAAFHGGLQLVEESALTQPSDETRSRLAELERLYGAEARAMDAG